MNLKLEELTVEQKLGMLYCARPRTDADIAYTVELIKKHALGSVQVNPKKPKHMEMVRQAADYPILIICDTETNFPTSDKQPISLMALSACNKPEFFEVFAKAIATDARKAGYNGTWGPVVDVLTGDGPCKVYRRFSDNVEKICQAAEIMCKVYARNGYMSCGKHYPGGGDMPYDSHMAPVPKTDTVDQLRQKGLVPYQYLMDRDLLPSIMTSHSTLCNIDPDNAGTMSAKVLGIIREMGWDGVCFTDSFAMMSILQKYGEENVLGLAIKAGNDIVLPNYRTQVEVSFGHLLKNYDDGMFTEERLNEAARRVIALQNRLALIPEPVDTFTQEDQVLYDSIARECITAVTDENVSPALDSKKSKLFVIMTDNDFQEDAETFETTVSAWYHPEQIAGKIREVFPDAKIEYFPEYPTSKDNERILLASAKCDETVFISYCVTKAYLGTDCITRRAESVINALNLSGRLGAVVHFGNPFAMKHLDHVSRLIFGYNMPDSQVYAIDVLAGSMPANGTLPFDVPLK